MSYGSLGVGSATVNGQLIPQLPAGGIFPGPAIAPILRSVIGAPAPTIGGAPSAAQAVTQTNAAAAPLNFIKSPVPLLLIMLIVGMAGLRFIHWA